MKQDAYIGASDDYYCFLVRVSGYSLAFWNEDCVLPNMRGEQSILPYSKSWDTRQTIYCLGILMNNVCQLTNAQKDADGNEDEMDYMDQIIKPSDDNRPIIMCCHCTINPIHTQGYVSHEQLPDMTFELLACPTKHCPGFTCSKCAKDQNIIDINGNISDTYNGCPLCKCINFTWPKPTNYKDFLSSEYTDDIQDDENDDRADRSPTMCNIPNAELYSHEHIRDEPLITCIATRDYVEPPPLVRDDGDYEIINCGESSDEEKEITKKKEEIHAIEKQTLNQNEFDAELDKLLDDSDDDDDDEQHDNEEKTQACPLDEQHQQITKKQKTTVHDAPRPRINKNTRCSICDTTENNAWKRWPHIIDGYFPTACNTCYKKEAKRLSTSDRKLRSQSQKRPSSSRNRRRNV